MQESRNLSASKIRKIATTRSLAAALQFRSHTCDLHRRDVKISCKNRRVAIVCVCVSASVRVYACVCVCVCVYAIRRETRVSPARFSAETEVGSIGGKADETKTRQGLTSILHVRCDFENRTKHGSQ